MARSPRWAAICAVAALMGTLMLLLSACGSDGDGAVRTVTVTTSDVEDAPDAAATEAEEAAANEDASTEGRSDESGDTDEVNGRTALIRTVGKDGRDGNVTFRVTGVKRQDAISTGYDQIRAPKGANLFVVSVMIRNDGKVKVDPFCGTSGIGIDPVWLTP